MANSELENFVKESLTSGQSKSAVRKVLQEAGWSEHEISSALNRFADVSFVIPVPVPRAQSSARDAFLYLVMFGMLYLSVYNAGDLLFDFINITMPDPLDTMPAIVTYRSIRMSIASVIIAFPVFLFIAMRIARTIEHDPVRRNCATRKWLTYLTLVAAAFIIVGDLILSLFNLLSGELTFRFALKALTTGAIAGTVFGYYFRTLSVDNEALGR